MVRRQNRMDPKLLAPVPDSHVAQTSLPIVSSYVLAVPHRLRSGPGHPRSTLGTHMASLPLPCPAEHIGSKHPLSQRRRARPIRRLYHAISRSICEQKRADLPVPVGMMVAGVMSGACGPPLTVYCSRPKYPVFPDYVRCHDELWLWQRQAPTRGRPL